MEWRKSDKRIYDLGFTIRDMSQGWEMFLEIVNPNSKI